MSAPDNGVNSPGKICGVFLAAGSSRRFAQDKLLARLPGGEPMAVASLRSYLQVLDEVVAVVRGDNALLERILEKEGARVARVRRSPAGMGYSLAAGVAHSRGAAGWIIGLADMPYVSAFSVARLAMLLRGGAQTVAPFYRGLRGNPVGFSCQRLEDLLSLHGDVGARHILQRYRPVQLELDDPGVLIDIDTPEALQTPLEAHIRRLGPP